MTAPYTQKMAAEIVERLRNVTEEGADPDLIFEAADIIEHLSLRATSQPDHFPGATKMVQPGLVSDDVADAVAKALRRAWQLGQTYWQQADSEFVSQHRKSDETQTEFAALQDEVQTLLTASPTPSVAGDEGGA